MLINGSKLKVGRDFSFLGKNRESDWIFPGQTIGFNLSITTNKLFIDKDKLRIEELIDYFNIRPKKMNKNVSMLK